MEAQYLELLEDIRQRECELEAVRVTNNSKIACMRENLDGGTVLLDEAIEKCEKQQMDQMNEIILEKGCRD